MFKIIGISDETVCECCGKENLKLTVVLARLDADGNEMEFVKFGRDCAAKATRQRKTAQAIENQARNAAAERERAERNKIHIVGEARSVRPFVVESVSSMGDCTVLCLANGLKTAVEKWAEQRYPNKAINVRPAI